MRPLPKDMLDYASAGHDVSPGAARSARGRAGERRGDGAGRRRSSSGSRGRGGSSRRARTTGYMRIKGARDLDRRELAIFRELVRFRDGIARELDRATFRVAGNEALFAVAKERPQTLDALGAIKGVPRGIAERRGGEMLAAVQRGIEVPEDQLPKFPRAPRWDRDADFDNRGERAARRRGRRRRSGSGSIRDSCARARSWRRSRGRSRRRSRSSRRCRICAGGRSRCSGRRF